MSSDITALKESRERLEQMAYFDALTGLPNRRLLSDRLTQAIGQASRSDTPAGDLLPRPRRLQADQRPVGPCRRRPAADRCRAPSDGQCPRRRYRQPARRRRVRRAARQPGPFRRMRNRPGAHPNLAQQALPAGRGRSPPLRQHGRDPVPARRRRSRHAAAPRRPGHVPGQTGRPQPLCAVRRRTRSLSELRRDSRKASSARLRTTSCSWPTSPRSICATAKSLAWKP
jgi:hypothetical protein